MNRVIEKWFAPWRQSTRVWQPPILDLERIWFHSLPCIFVVGMTPYQLINCCGWFFVSWCRPTNDRHPSKNEWVISEGFSTGPLFPVTNTVNSCSDSFMMTSSNVKTVFRVTGPLWGEFTGPGEFPAQRPVTRSFDVFFDLRLNKRLSKQLWGWWLETPSWSFWRHCNVWSVSYVDVTQHNITITALKGQ